MNADETLAHWGHRISIAAHRLDGENRPLNAILGSVPEAGAAGAFLARSQARHRYQLATERKGRPALAAAEDHVGLGQVGGFNGARFGQALEGERVAFAHAVVGHGQHVGPAHAEDEQHLHGPGADAAHLGEAFDDVGVGHFADGGVRGDGAVEGAGGEVLAGP